MVWFRVKKRLCLVLASALVFVIMGAFTFAAVEPFVSGDFEDRGPISEGFFSQVDYTVDCLAEGVSIMNKARGASFSPLRGVISLEIKNIGTALSHCSLKTIEKTNHLTIKNPILLKLRI
ncbi:MAG: hypothetical protein LBG08_01125 [Spirochaetaceae bacterium]|jgi:hypothetical protein|nr:hypothetical protein [Spirochaetaceae bacterium]